MLCCSWTLGRGCWGWRDKCWVQGVQSLAEGPLRSHGGRLRGHFGHSRIGSTHSQKKLAALPAWNDLPLPNNLNLLSFLLRLAYENRMPARLPLTVVTSSTSLACQMLITDQDIFKWVDRQPSSVSSNSDFWRFSWSRDTDNVPSSYGSQSEL